MGKTNNKRRRMTKKELNKAIQEDMKAVINAEGKKNLEKVSYSNGELRCPYCGGKVVIREEREIFPHLFKNFTEEQLNSGKRIFNTEIKAKDGSLLTGVKHGKLYMCENYPRCDSYVKIDPRNKNQYSLANKELRKLRSEAHHWIWVTKKLNIYPKETIYSEIAAITGMSHISALREDNCNRIINNFSSLCLKSLKYKETMQRVMSNSDYMKKQILYFHNKQNEKDGWEPLT